MDSLVARKFEIKKREISERAEEEIKHIKVEFRRRGMMPSGSFLKALTDKKYEYTHKMIDALLESYQEVQNDTGQEFITEKKDEIRNGAKALASSQLAGIIRALRGWLNRFNMKHLTLENYTRRDLIKEALDKAEILIETNERRLQPKSGTPQIFMCWSKESSRKLAKFLTKWLKDVTGFQPWMSPSIEKGTAWFSQISNRLAKSNLGIICLTQENAREPWILFESGAIYKGSGESRIWICLLGMTNREIPEPLSHFQHVVFNKEDFYKFLKDINEHIRNRISPADLKASFDKKWPALLRFTRSLTGQKQKMKKNFREKTDNPQIEGKKNFFGIAFDSGLNAGTTEIRDSHPPDYKK